MCTTFMEHLEPCSSCNGNDHWHAESGGKHPNSKDKKELVSYLPVLSMSRFLQRQVAKPEFPHMFVCAAVQGSDEPGPLVL